VRVEQEKERKIIFQFPFFLHVVCLCVQKIGAEEEKIHKQPWCEKQQASILKAVKVTDGDTQSIHP
jgi:hypothetical protein